jgi:hypothetical protein
VVFPSTSRGDLKKELKGDLNGHLSVREAPKPEAAATISISRKPLQSGKRVPINRSTNTHKLSFQTATSLGRNMKGSILIASNHHHQRNSIPPLEYYAKGSLLKIPEHVKSRNPVNKTLTSKKLTPIDPVLSPDQVSAC